MKLRPNIKKAMCILNRGSASVSWFVKSFILFQQKCVCWNNVLKGIKLVEGTKWENIVLYFTIYMYVVQTMFESRVVLFVDFFHYYFTFGGCGKLL